MAENDELTSKIIGAAIEVHKKLGPGLLEKTYQECLCIELEDRGINYKREVYLPIRYNNREIKDAYRIDIIIENRVIVELKSVEKIDNVHKAQLLTYLKLTDKKIGLLINFNTNLLKNGIVRMIL